MGKQSARVIATTNHVCTPAPPENQAEAKKTVDRAIHASGRLVSTSNHAFVQNELDLMCPAASPRTEPEETCADVGAQLVNFF